MSSIFGVKCKYIYYYVYFYIYMMKEEKYIYIIIMLLQRKYHEELISRVYLLTYLKS